MKVKFLALSLFIGLIPVFSQDIVLTGGVIRTADNYQVGHESWASVGFRLKNMSSRDREFKIQFYHSGRPQSVYEYLVKAPAKSDINHAFPVSMGNVPVYSGGAKDNKPKSNKEKRRKKISESAYVLTLLEKSGDRYVPAKGVKKVDTNMDFKDLSNVKTVAFLTDGIVNIGNLAKRLQVPENSMAMTYVYTKGRAMHWSTYTTFDILVIMNVDYATFNPLTVAAIKDYVKMGGTLLFAHHDGIMGASGTTLEELLPVVPTGVRSVNSIPEVDKFLRTQESIHTREGMQFVESISKPGTLATCTWGDFPVITWKKYGMGMTAVMNFSPTQAGFAVNDSEGFRNFWKYILRQTVRPADMSTSKNGKVTDAVNMLNGLTIPGPGVILGYLSVFAALVVIIFAVLIKLGKPVIAWVSIIALSLIMTAVIFNKAYSSSSDKKDRTAAVFSQIPMVAEAPTVKVYSIFSRSNEQLNFDGDILSDRFKKLPKKRSSDLNERGQKATVEEVITGAYEADRSFLSELNIQGLSARVFSVLSRGSSPGMEPPVLSLNTSGPEIKLSDSASEMDSAGHIYIAGPSGVMRMEKKGNLLVKSETQVSSGKMDQTLQGVISSIPLIRPLLFFTIEDIKEDELLNDTYSINGMKLYSVPLKETFGSEILLPGEFNRISSMDNTTMIYRNGEWQLSRQMSPKPQTYEFTIIVPVGYESIQTSEAIVDLRYFNGGNIEITPVIGKSEGVKQKDGTYLISNLPAGVVKDGKFTIALHVKSKQQVMDQLEAHKLNRWKVEELKVALKGKLKKSNTVEF